HRGITGNPKGGIASAKTGNVHDRDMAGSGTGTEHTSMEDVVNTGGVCSSSQDGIASYKGTEERALKMEYVLSSVSKHENRNKRISFFAEEVYIAGQAYSLQLYGYFVDILMDYRVVRGNLMRMWRVYDIEDITKTNSEIKYPSLGNRHACVGKLEVKYQWRPPLCNHCTTFSHTTLYCKIKPRTDKEIAANTIKEAINVNSSDVTDTCPGLNEGFLTVGKKNKPIVTRARTATVKSDNYSNGNMYVMLGKGENNGRRQFVDKTIPIKNSFNILRDEGGDIEDMGGINVNEEFESKVWPELKEEVDILLEADDEGDVKFDDEGIVVDMKPEFEVNVAEKSNINAACNVYVNDLSERSGGGSKITSAMADCRDCGIDNGITKTNGCLTEEGNKSGNGSYWISRTGSCCQMDVVSIRKVKGIDNGITKTNGCLTEEGNKSGNGSYWISRTGSCCQMDVVSIRKVKGNLFDNVKCLKAKLAPVQASMSTNPHNKALREEEMSILKSYKAAIKDEESFLRQKSKVKLLKAGDHNSNDPKVLFSKKLSDAEALYMVRSVTDEEIKLALFNIDGNKAPGPDDFFSHGKLLKEINATVISLVPKMASPSKNVVGGEVCKAVKEFFLHGKLLKEERESGVMNNKGLDEAFIEGISAKIKNIDGKLRMPIRGEPLKSSRSAHVPSVEKESKVENVHTYVGGPPIKSILKKAVTFDKEDANKEGTETLSGSAQCVKENVVDLGINDGVHASDFTTLNFSFASILCPKATVHKGDFRTLVNEEIIADSDCVLPKATTDLVKNRAYAGESTVNLLCSFLNLARAGNWLTLSNRGLKTSWKHSPKEPVIYYQGQEMDFRSFMMQEIDGEFKFLPEGCNDYNQCSPSLKSVNNEAPVIDEKPLTSVHPSNFIEDVTNSDDASAGDNENPLVGTFLPP
nr:hypothetical protein [Tanacetum cinerariifolium]